MFETIEEYFAEIKNLPENPKKKDWERVFISMATHTRKRVPRELLLARRPNEEPTIHEYRVANYRPITYGSMNKALDDLYRIVSGISFTLNAPENVKDYLINTVVDNYCNSAATQNEIISAKLFIEKICLKRDIEDPNGFLIWHPTGEGVIDSAKKVAPMPKLVLSEQYVYSDQNVFIYLSDEKSPLRADNNKMVLEGDIYHFITKTDYWRMQQVGTLSDPKWEIELIYKHGLDAFPVIILGGDMNTEGYYDSYFSPYLAFGDEAIHQFSDWQATMTTSSFPIKEVFANECLVRRVNKETSPSDQEEGYRGGGNGEFELMPLQKSPYGMILRKIPENPNLPDALDVNVPSVRFIAPPVEVAKYAGESWQMLIDRAEKALNIDMTVGVDQSGKAKQLDKEAQYSMITKIGNNFFDNIYLNSLKIIDGLVNRIKLSSSKCSINKPSTFWVKNELDLINEITTLKTSRAPYLFLAEATTDLAKKRFNGNPVNEKIYTYISTYDPYFIHTIDEKNNLLASSVMSKEEYVLSNHLYSILNQIVRELSPDWLLNAAFDKIKSEVEKRIKPFIPKEPELERDDNGNPLDGEDR